MQSSPEAASSCPCKCKQKQSAWRRFCGVALLAFAAIALLRSFNAAPRDGEARAEADAAETAVAQGPVLFYFHGTQRCRTCTRMEQMVRELLAARFDGTHAAPRVPLRCVNVDLPESRHYVTDFALTMRTFVLVAGARFEMLDQCWQLAHDEAAFKDYLARAIADFAAREGQP